jgi:FMN phosphatase YigB (HAD superfamily)
LKDWIQHLMKFVGELPAKSNGSKPPLFGRKLGIAVMARPQVILFDVNETLLDLKLLKESVGKALGGRPELAPLWFTTLLQHSFEVVLSVEDIGMFKPHAHLHRWAARRVGADVSECLLVAAHGFDVAGVAWAGMKSAFIARPGQQLFPLGPTPDIRIPSFSELPRELAKTQ